MVYLDPDKENLDKFTERTRLLKVSKKQNKIFFSLIEFFFIAQTKSFLVN